MVIQLLWLLIFMAKARIKTRFRYWLTLQALLKYKLITLALHQLLYASYQIRDILQVLYKVLRPK